MGLLKPNVQRMLDKRDLKGLIKALRYLHWLPYLELFESFFDGFYLLGIETSKEVHVSAVKALGQIGDAQAVQPLVSTLEDRESEVRQAAAEALGQIGDAQAVQPLVSTLEDRDVGVRQAGAKALTRIGAKEAIEPLITALRNDKSVWAHLTYYSALEELVQGTIPESATQNLVETVAAEIRRLYSRTKTITEQVVTGGHYEKEALEGPYSNYERNFYANTIWVDETTSRSYQISDPDVEGIRRLISLTPKKLHERVRALSGEVKGKSGLWPESALPT